MRETTQPIAVTFPGATARTGIARTRLYELVGAGVLDARKAGRRTLIMTESLDRYVASLPPASIRAPRQVAVA